MMTLSEMVCKRPEPEEKRRREGRTEALCARLPCELRKPHARYEAEVFNFLFDKSEQLGIRSVIRFKNLLLDGAVELVDGKRLAIEIKFRMNWLKACQAEWQFRSLLKRHLKAAGRVDDGIVFFKEFSGDWGKLGPSGLRENGWNHWYRAHSKVDGIHVSLLRFRGCNCGLETFPESSSPISGK